MLTIMVLITLLVRDFEAFCDIFQGRISIFTFFPDHFRGSVRSLMTK